MPLRLTEMISRLLGAAVLIVSGAAPAATPCPDSDMTALKAALAGKGPTEVVFFASWCSSCLPHLQAEHPPGTIFVATFDERARAEEVATTLDLKAPCYTDQGGGGGIATALDVRALPAKRAVSFPR